MTRNNEAREFIMGSIRSSLAASRRHDLAAHAPHDLAADAPHDFTNSDHDASVRLTPQSPPQTAVPDVVERFKRNLESVDGHCIVVQTSAEVEQTLKQLTRGKSIATSNTPPPTKDLFNYDVGITTAQAAIAETGTLVLDSSAERNRLVSLVPPVHIAILDASRIYQTLGETLAALHRDNEVSASITFITGPSRTADIELTLAIGVHGPQELYVIVNQSS